MALSAFEELKCSSDQVHQESHDDSDELVETSSVRLLLLQRIQVVSASAMDQFYSFLQNYGNAELNKLHMFFSVHGQGG
jgi:hypothetical protein